MNESTMLAFFAELVCTGLAWQLQGCYGRQAQVLIEAGYLSRSGEILKDID
jgi:hypothetical protein